jgi:hypothetical protein
MAEGDSLFPGEKFPATRSEELTIPDVNESSLSEIQYAINEMFARHGGSFHDPEVRKEFESFSWYHARPGVTFDEIKNEFSDVEKHNLDVLDRCRSAKTAASRRHQRTRAARGHVVQPESAGQQFLRAIIQGVADGLQNNE